MSFGSLQQDQRTVSFADGTIIKCLSCFGQDVINIFVPQVFVGGEPEYREREEITYYPAFEAYDGSEPTSSKIGYVICRGGGFNPPYEFIEVDNEKTELEPFEWGQGYIFNEYQQYDAPGSTVEDYLIPKKLLIETERELYGIPPSGTKNRAFMATSTLTTNIASADTSTRFNCCWINGVGVGSQYPGKSGYSHDIDRGGARADTFVFCVSPEGENPGFALPEEYLTTDGWMTEEISYSHYHSSVGTNLPIFAGHMINSGTKTALRIQGGSGAAWGPPYQSVSEETCAYFMPIIGAWSIPEPEAWESTFFLIYDDIGNVQLTEDYQYNSSSEEDTSVEDAERYALIYSLDIQQEVEVKTVTCSGYPCGTQPEGDISGPYNHVRTSDITSDDSEETYIALSDETKEITEHIGKFMACKNVRYYRVGDKEFALANVESDFEDDGYNTTYFYATKGDGPMNFAEPATLSGLGRYLKIPDIEDTEGNQVYTHGQFRLIRETIIIKEMATAEQPGLFRKII